MTARNRFSRPLALAIAALFIFPGLGAARASAASVSVDAVLILALNDREAGADEGLKGIESKLRKVFQFKYYERYGGGGGKFDLPGATTISLGHDMRLKIAGTAEGDKRVRFEVRWLKGKKTLINTTVVSKRGQPMILGGPAHKNGTLIVSLTAR